MQSFVDEASITISSGNGGAGSVSFRREKYVPRGGPDGGDGGAGGNIILKVRHNLKTLAHLKMKRDYRAKDGEPGRGRRQHGRNGKDIIIPVPPGSVIKDADSGTQIKDLVREGEEWIAAEGGRGGQGNWHYKSSTRQAPRFAQPGLPGITRKLFVELDIIADIGFVGLPNAGKSTLLSVLTNAHPKIASYPFTTRIPNLGVLRKDSVDVVLADIPGIIEGASHGAGLGYKFLKHISRTVCVAFILDLSRPDPGEDLETIENEIKEYSLDLLNKKRLVIGTKLDIAGTGEQLEKLKQGLSGEPLLGISAVTRQGLEELEKMFLEAVH